MGQIYPNIQVQIHKDAMNADLNLPPKLPKDAEMTLRYSNG